MDFTAIDNIDIPELLPIQNDLVFKRLLTHKDAMPVLRLVTSGLLKTTVTNVFVHNIETPKESIEAKDQKFDVSCQTDSGTYVAIEMQADHMEGDDLKNKHRNIVVRAEYGMCDLFASQKGKGIPYEELMKAYQTTFLGYTIFPDRPHFERRILLRDEEGEALTEDVGIVFIELPKVGKILTKTAKEMTRLEAFASFMVTVGKPKLSYKLQELIRYWGELRVAYDLLNSMSRNADELALFRSRLAAERTRITELNAKMKEGGQVERIKFAHMMRADGEPEAKVIRYTGYTFKDLDALEFVDFDVLRSV